MRENSSYKWFIKWYCYSALDFWIVRAHEDVVDADAVKVGQYEQGVRGRDALAAFKLRDQRLVDARFHLKRDLRKAPFPAQFAQVVLHTNHQYYFYMTKH